MRKMAMSNVLSIAVLCVLSAGCANNGNADEATNSVATVNEQSTDLEKVGYSIGYMMAEGNKDMVDDLDLDTFELGFRDAYADKEAALTDEQMQEVVTSYQEKKETELMEKMQQKAVENKEAGDKYLAENATKEGVQSTESGLQYKTIKEGTGKQVGENDMVKVHYEGKLIDGTVFDSSKERDEPAVFAVKQMIPGFAEGLQLMKEGGEYQLFIPADLAYGETGNPAIDPNSTLIFNVEMIEVNPEMPAQ